jgi:protein TonB
VIVSQHTTHESPSEKKFRVNLRKNITMQATASSRQSDRTPFKPSARKLLQIQKFSPSQFTSQKTQREHMAEIQPFVPVLPRMLKAQTVPDQSVQNKNPAIRESVVVARELPTPIPTPAPTPALTKKPIPVPTRSSTKIPETKKRVQPVKTPDIPIPTATIPPLSSPTVIAKSTALPESDFTPIPLPTSVEKTNATTEPLLNNKRSEVNPVERPETTGIEGSTEEEQTVLLRHYLQEVTAQIDAVKCYPRRARRKGWEGTVVIKLSILPTGEVGQAELVKPSQHKTLDEAAFQAIIKAQPFPHFYEDLSLPSITINIPIQFVLGK